MLKGKLLLCKSFHSHTHMCLILSQVMMSHVTAFAHSEPQNDLIVVPLHRK